MIPNRIQIHFQTLHSEKFRKKGGADRSRKIRALKVCDGVAGAPSCGSSRPASATTAAGSSGAASVPLWLPCSSSSGASGHDVDALQLQTNDWGNDANAH